MKGREGEEKSMEGDMRVMRKVEGVLSERGLKGGREG